MLYHQNNFAHVNAGSRRRPASHTFSPATSLLLWRHIKTSDSSRKYQPLATQPCPLGGSPVTIHLCVEDADKIFNQAVAAGATAVMPPMDAFWGDRYGLVKDPFGHHWAFATHIKDMTPEEMMEASKACFEGAPA